MMKTYARIEGGIIVEIIAPMADESGGEIPIEHRFTPALIAEMVDVTTASPSPTVGWAYSDSVFTPPIPSDFSPAQLWASIKAERDRRVQSGGYKVGTKWFHSDTFSRTQQMGLVMLGASIPVNVPWKTMDGTVITMTQTLAGQIFATAAASDIAIFAAAETHKAAMETSADPAAYDFSAGWPAIFAG